MDDGTAGGRGVGPVGCYAASMGNVAEESWPKASRRPRRGSWRLRQFGATDDSSREDRDALDWIADLDAPRRGRRRRGLWSRRRAGPFFGISRSVWAAGLFFLFGVIQAVRMLGFPDVDLLPVWMTWAATGACLGAGFWCAAVPLDPRPAARYLKVFAALLALAPVVLHLVGVI